MRRLLLDVMPPLEKRSMRLQNDSQPAIVMVDRQPHRFTPVDVNDHPLSTMAAALGL
ncbi:MAG: hypothetical protein HC790_07570 [Acaryochloridaceae cyanobacterium CSU_3_4]|nr:hypothetical protein [Acaryochloridaceae cyanobacterium CSU_3_4]